MSTTQSSAFKCPAGWVRAFRDEGERELVNVVGDANSRCSGCNRPLKEEEESTSSCRCTPHFPDEVLGRIMASLPLLSVLNCRLVEKRWKAITQEASFRQMYARVSGELSVEYMRELERSREFVGSQLVSSIHNLVLVSTFADASEHLFVVNSTMATVTRIPAMLPPLGASKHDLSVVGMVTNSATGTYKILVAQEGARPVRLQVYDSEIAAWNWVGALNLLRQSGWQGQSSTIITEGTTIRTPGIPEGINLPPVTFHVLHVALHDGALHCLSVLAARYFHVLRLGPDSQWVEVPGFFPPPPTTFLCDFRCRPVLFESRRGNLMLAGAQVTGPISIRVTLWQYDRRAQKWSEVAFAQEQVQEEDPDVCGASYSDNTFFYLDACADHICLGAFPSIRNPEPKVLLYSVSDEATPSLSRLRDEDAKKKLA